MRVTRSFSRGRIPFGVIVVVALVSTGCSAEPQPPSATTTTPVYNPQTGRLEEIVSDRDGDGVVDTRAFMDGTRLLRIEIDRDNDGRVDRWEFYISSPGSPQGVLIERAEEANGPDATVTRRDVYEAGVLRRAEEDTDLDGRIDKWEVYENGRLAHVDLDLAGQGRPTRRFVYGPDGTVARMEADEDGDGQFEPFVPTRGEGR